MPSWRSRLGGLVIAGVVLLGAVCAAAQEQIGTYEQLSVSSSAIGITAAIMNPSGRTQMTVCHIQAEEMVRWRADGTNPTSTVGALLTRVDAALVLPNAIARRFRAISTSAQPALVNVTCFP